MKGDENRIPYMDNILILINLIEYDVILGVLVNHAMTRNVLKISSLLHLFYFAINAQHRTMLLGHKCMSYKRQ